MVFVGACTSDTSGAETPSSAPSGPSSSVTTTVAEQDAELISIALETIEAWNTSVDAFLGRFAEDGEYLNSPVAEVSTVNSVSFYIGLGDVVTVHSCETKTATVGGGVECRITGVDALSGITGASFDGYAAAQVVDGQIVRWDWGGGGGKLDYTDEMVEWVREQHPDVFESSFVDPTCGTSARVDCWGDWAESAAAAAALLELHDEYLALSPVDAAAQVDAPPEANLPEPEYEVITTSVSTDSTRDVWVYEPDGDGVWPVVYAIPGSGGDARGDLSTVATELARRGVLVFATDWAGEPDSEVSVAEVECGYRLALDLAGDYGGDLSRQPVVFGYSAGATTALNLTLGEAEYGPGGDFAVCFDGVPRPAASVALSGCHSHFAFGLETDSWGNDNALLLLPVGNDDSGCTVRQSAKAGEALRQAGYDVSIIAIPDADHGDVVFRDIANKWAPLPPDHLPGRYTVQMILNAIDATATN